MECGSLTRTAYPLLSILILKSCHVFYCVAYALLPNFKELINHLAHYFYWPHNF